MSDITLNNASQPVSLVGEISLPTYRASSFFVPGATAQDVFTISSSGAKIIMLRRVVVSGFQTTSSARLIRLLKRSTLNTAGTSSLVAAVPSDSRDVASVSTVRSYTANPTAGTLVGSIGERYIMAPVITPTNAQGAAASNFIEWEFDVFGECKPPMIVNATELISVNLNGVSWTGPVLSVSFEWMEAPV